MRLIGAVTKVRPDKDPAQYKVTLKGKVTDGYDGGLGDALNAYLDLAQAKGADATMVALVKKIANGGYVDLTKAEANTLFSRLGGFLGTVQGLVKEDGDTTEIDVTVEPYITWAEQAKKFGSAGLDDQEVADLNKQVQQEVKDGVKNAAQAVVDAAKPVVDAAKPLANAVGGALSGVVDGIVIAGVVGVGLLGLGYVVAKRWGLL